MKGSEVKWIGKVGRARVLDPCRQWSGSPAEFQEAVSKKEMSMMKSALRINFGGQGCPRWGQREIMSSTVVLTKLSATPMGAEVLGWPLELSPATLEHWFRHWTWAALERRKKQQQQQQYSSAKAIHKESAWGLTWPHSQQLVKWVLCCWKEIQAYGFYFKHNGKPLKSFQNGVS